MRFRKLLRSLGFLLILSGLGLFLFSQIQTGKAQSDCERIVAQIQSVLPEAQAGVMDSYSSMAMPVLQIGGQDYVCLIRIPAFGMELPVGSSWNSGRVSQFPCRFSGTVYDGSLIIGGADQPGQFDCFDQLDPGCEITVTDMTGAEFTYTVFRIDRSRSADAEVLNRYDADLTLFVRDSYSLEYLIVRCEAAG